MRAAELSIALPARNEFVLMASFRCAGIAKAPAGIKQCVIGGVATPSCLAAFP
jgi:hypothetical protein